MALLLCVWMLVGLGTRVALMAKSASQIDWDVSVTAAFFWGAFFDAASAVWWAAPLAFFFALVPLGFFRARLGRAGTHVFVFTAIYLMLFTAVAEWCFWDEFGCRFNFIAVDYLVYTTEVVGNIRESYPMGVILGSALAVTAGIYAALWRSGVATEWMQEAGRSERARWRAAALWCIVLGITAGGITEQTLPSFHNNYTRELAKSGPWSLLAAFRSNQLDFDRFYPTMPAEAAFARVKRDLSTDGSTPLTGDPTDLLRLVRHSGEELRLNVVQITVESLSASFVSRFGNQKGLTPNLDALAERSLVFDQFYATGNRTDRGMEALSLSLPPTPGRSLVKRPNNEHLATLGAVFRSKGYNTAFLYGGYGYFDNMNHFFGENGYRVVDRTAVADKDITFANVWGACDEDLYRWTLREADRDSASGKPFYYFLMTTSNHRPFTYPDGKIDLPSKKAGRDGGVKYTDYAFGEFLRAAEAKPWFKNTVFVIVADHCASSAGRTELPVQNYHIPLIIYAPGGQIRSGAVSTLASQIDFAPTLLGLLNWSYSSRFFGRDVLRAGTATPRAFIGNYQKLGLLESGRLQILKPVRQASSLEYDAATGQLRPIERDPRLFEETVAYYQAASYVYKNRKQGEPPVQP